MFPQPDPVLSMTSFFLAFCNVKTHCLGFWSPRYGFNQGWNARFSGCAGPFIRCRCFSSVMALGSVGITYFWMVSDARPPHLFSVYCSLAESGSPRFVAYFVFWSFRFPLLAHLPLYVLLDVFFSSAGVISPVPCLSCGGFLIPLARTLRTSFLCSFAGPSHTLAALLFLRASEHIFLLHPSSP